MPIDPPDDIELELVESTGNGDAPADPAALPPGAPLEFAFAGVLWYWRGPAPYHFISVPPNAARAIHAIAAAVTYGWGMIPAEVRIGGSGWSTALWAKDGGYVLPIKDRYRKAERLVLDDIVEVQLIIRR